MIKIAQSEKLDLTKIKPGDTGDLSREEATTKLASLTQKVGELQELMFAAGQNSLLIVLQGRDTSGKDGTIRHLLQFMNAQSTRVAPFKVPTPIELGHDFLWRVHQQAPMKGETVVFNRSHYEDVLVVRVHDFVPKQVWEKRFDHINNFEKMLTDGGTILVKCMLHISKEEQEQRLLEREKDDLKAWKLSVNDWKEREFWGKYTEAYEDALSKCSPSSAEWIVVPSDEKWYRNYIITKAIYEALLPYEEQWQTKLNALGNQLRDELKTFRESI